MNNRAKEKTKWHRKLAAYWVERGQPEFCEARWKGCINTFITPAHSKKRRFIQTEEDYFEIAWLCVKCHEHADQKMTHEEMERAIKGIIAIRRW